MLVAYDSALEKVQRRSHAGNTDLGEIARRAGLSAFGEAVRDRLPSLWDPTAEDVRASVSALKGTEQFASMALRVSSSKSFTTTWIAISTTWSAAIGSRSRLTIFGPSMRRSGDTVTNELWSSHLRQGLAGEEPLKDGKQITGDDVRRFSAYTVEKIRLELEQRKGAS